MNIKQISELCGVSTCTVSRVLSGRAREFRISDKTENKVMRIAEKSGYRPNYLAHSLNTDKTFMIGVIFANKVDSFLGSIMEGIEARLRNTDYRMVVATCEGKRKIQDEELQRMYYRRVDGVILYPLALPEGLKYQLPKKMPSVKKNIPILLVGRSIREKRDQVMMADEKAGMTIAKAFMAKGGRRFAFVMRPTTCTSDMGRRDGFVGTLRAAGIPQKDIRIISESGQPSSAILKQLIASDCIFSVNTSLLLDYLKRIRNDTDLSRKQLAGIGDFEARRLLPYSVRVLAIPGHELGKRAAETLLWRIEHPAAKPRLIHVPLIDDNEK